MLYACEAWTDSLKHEKNINDMLCKNNLEKFHISVLKRLLGVHKKTTNISILLETGAHPITLSAHIQSIKYFVRPTITKNSLLGIYYINEKESTLHTDNFMKYIKDKLNTIGMSNIWNEQIIQGKDFSKDAKSIENIKTRIHDISSQTLVSALIENTGKMTFLQQIKSAHKSETYLYINNFENRRAISEHRTSSDKFEIEPGRRNNIAQDQRICKNCTMDKVEDENHLMFECRVIHEPVHFIKFTIGRYSIRYHTNHRHLACHFKYGHCIPKRGHELVRVHSVSPKIRERKL